MDSFINMIINIQNSTEILPPPLPSPPPFSGLIHRWILICNFWRKKKARKKPEEAEEEKGKKRMLPPDVVIRGSSR